MKRTSKLTNLSLPRLPREERIMEKVTVVPNVDAVRKGRRSVINFGIKFIQERQERQRQR